jgi:MIP family channel proteins
MSDRDVDATPKIVRAAAAEFIGVFIFVFSGCAAAISNTNIFAIACAFGLAITVMAFSTGDLSGGHLNPAVSWALFITGYISLYRLAVYVMCQFLGAICGALFLSVVTKGREVLIPGHPTTELGANGFGHMITSLEALGVEIITTFSLVFVVFCTAVDPSPKGRMQYAAIPIGFTVIIGIIATGNISGGSMNPARSLGPAVATGDWAPMWVYFLGPLVGGSLAGLVHRYGFLGRNPESVRALEED